MQDEFAGAGWRGATDNRVAIYIADYTGRAYVLPDQFRSLSEKDLFTRRFYRTARFCASWPFGANGSEWPDGTDDRSIDRSIGDPTALRHDYDERVITTRHSHA